MAINPYDAPKVEVERVAAFRPRRLGRFLGIAVVNLVVAVTSTAVVIPLFFYLVVRNVESDVVTLPMLYVPMLTVLNAVGLVASALGLLAHPRWGWIMTVGYCAPGVLAVIVIVFLTRNPFFLVGAPYPLVVLALLLSPTARQAAGVSRAGPRISRRGGSVPS